MYHACVICRIGCIESGGRFDRQFGLVRKRAWEFVQTTCELLQELRAKVLGKVRTKILRNAVRAETALLVVLKFFVPGHLNRFELAFIR